MGRGRNCSQWGHVKQRFFGTTSRHCWYALILICVLPILHWDLLSHARVVHTRYANHTKSYEKGCDNISTVFMPVDVLSDITAGEWESRGGELHIPWNRIEVIDIDEYMMERKRQAVLRAWYEDREEAYWEEIVESLKRMEQRHLANRIAACKGRRCVNFSGDTHVSNDSTNQKTPPHVHTATTKGEHGSTDHTTLHKNKHGNGNGKDTSEHNSASHTTTMDDGLDTSGHSIYTARAPDMPSSADLHCRDHQDIAHSDHSTSRDTAHSDHSTSRDTAHSDHSTSRDTAHSDHSTSRDTAHSDHSTSRDTAHSDHSTSRDTAHSDHSTSRDTAHSDHSTSRDTAHSDHSTSRDTAHSDHSTSRDTASHDYTTPFKGHNVCGNAGNKPIAQGATSNGEKEHCATAFEQKELRNHVKVLLHMLEVTKEDVPRVQTQDSKTPRLVLDQKVAKDQLMRNCPSLHINVMPVWPQDQQNDEEVDVCSFALFFLRILLLLGGDVERNPGPETDRQPGETFFRGYAEVMEETQQLNVDDLRFVIKAVHSVCANWEGIGLSLLVRGRDEIKKRFPNDPLKCLIGVLTNWLQLQYNREKDPELPSWKKLATVVGEKVGGANPRKGKYIEQHYKELQRFNPGEAATKADANRIVSDDDDDALVAEMSGLLDGVFVRWYEIGVLLGVRVGDLNVIQSDGTFSQKECLSKLLKVWLTGSGDGVERSWRVLVDAVEHPAGGNNPAEAMKMARRHPLTAGVPSPSGMVKIGHSTLQHHFADITGSSLDPGTLAAHLFAQNLISKTAMEEATTAYGPTNSARLTRIVMCVMSNGVEDSFRKFVSAIMKDESNVWLAEKLIETYRSKGGTWGASSSGLSHPKPTGVAGTSPSATEPASHSIFGERPITWQLNLIKYKNDNDGKIQRLRVLDAIAVHWLKVGLNLEISEDHLRIIRERENNDPRKCAPAMVNKWLQSGQDPTWAKLIEALEDSKLATLVEDLKMALPRMKDDHIGPVLVTKDLETPDSQANYTARLYTESDAHNVFIAVFSICRQGDEENLETVLKEQYPKIQFVGPRVREQVTFNGDIATLVCKPVRGWIIQPDSPIEALQITRKDVDSSSGPPMIKLTFSLDHSYSGEDLELTFMVYVEGLTPKVECSWSFSPELEEQRRKLQASFEKAMGEKHCQTILQTIFLGLPGCGKSTLIKRATGQKITYEKRKESGHDPTSTSTGAAENTIQAAVIKAELEECSTHAVSVDISHDSATTPEGSHWRLMPEVLDEALKLLTELKDSKPASELPAATGESSRADSLSSEKRQEDTRSSSDTAAAIDTTEHAQPPESTPTVQATQYTDIEEVSKIVEAAMSNERKLIEARDYVKEATTVYLTDTGGQLEFQDFFTILVSGPTIFVLVFRLDLDLNEKFKITYKGEHMDTPFEYESEITVKEALLQTFASIACLGVQAKVIFVATHKDLAEDPDTQLDQVCKELGEHPLIRDNKTLLHMESDKLLVLAIDTHVDDVLRFQKVVESVPKSADVCFGKIKARTSWLFFGLAARRMESRVISIEQCKELASRCGIKSHNESSDELENVLSFFHEKVGLIRYFKNTMPNIVILNPQAIFDKVTELVTESFTYQRLFSSEIASQFRKGKFSNEVLQTVMRKCSKTSEEDMYFTPDMLVTLLCDLKIIAPYGIKESEQQYFMPTAVYHIEGRSRFSGTPHIPEGMKLGPVLPLLITFKYHYVPKGMYGALIAHLMENSTTENPWVLCDKNSFRNHLYFKLGLHMVSIKFLATHLEIYLYIPTSRDDSDKITKRCSMVYESIKEGITTVAEKLHYKVEPIPAFYSKSHHLAVRKYDVQIDETFFQCTVSDQILEDSETCMRWFGCYDVTAATTRNKSDDTHLATRSSTSIFDKRPTLLEFQSLCWEDGDISREIRIMDEVKADWRNIGIALGFSGVDLDTIEEARLRKPDRCIESIFTNWSQRFENYSWNGLITALRRAGFPDLAIRVTNALPHKV